MGAVIAVDTLSGALAAWVDGATGVVTAGPLMPGLVVEETFAALCGELAAVVGNPGVSGDVPIPPGLATAIPCPFKPLAADAGAREGEVWDEGAIASLFRSSIFFASSAARAAASLDCRSFAILSSARVLPGVVPLDKVSLSGAVALGVRSSILDSTLPSACRLALLDWLKGAALASLRR